MLTELSTSFSRKEEPRAFCWREGREKKKKKRKRKLGNLEPIRENEAVSLAPVSTDG